MDVVASIVGDDFSEIACVVAITAKQKENPMAVKRCFMSAGLYHLELQK